MREGVFGALALLAAAAVGCGGNTGTTGAGGSGGQGTTTTTTSSSVTTGTGGAGGDGGGGSSGVGGALTCNPGEGIVLAGTKLTFGEGNNGQWKKVGFNIDGLVSTAGSTDLCQPAEGAFTVTPYPDGDNGIDNSFGKNLLPVLLGLYPQWPTVINDGIAQGIFTVLLQLDCLPPTGDVPVLNTRLFGGENLSPPPKFDGTDKWPVAPELLSNPNDPQSSTVLFKNASVKGQAYDSGKDATFILTVPVAFNGMTSAIKLTLYAAHITMTLADDRKSATAGMVGGVLNTEEFVAEIKKVGYLAGLCDSPIFPGVIEQIRQSSDIMSDGTQDPMKTCDGISIGLAFEMKQAQIGDVGMANPPGMSCQ